MDNEKEKRRRISGWIILLTIVTLLAAGAVSFRRLERYVYRLGMYVTRMRPVAGKFTVDLKD